MRAEKTDERMEDALADAVDLLTRRVVKYRKRLGTKLTGRSSGNTRYRAGRKHGYCARKALCPEALQH